MVPTRLFKATVLALLVTMTAVATVGHVFHDASCSAACELAATVTPDQPVADSHSSCSHGHSHTATPLEENQENAPNEHTPSHDGDQCGVCVFLSQSSPPVLLSEAPRCDESIESISVQSDSLFVFAPRTLTTARGPPTRVA
ncbi:MAG: hypothetical protein AB8G99_08160 [Planctomycetaceae bacterium]